MNQFNQHGKATQIAILEIIRAHFINEH